MMRKQTIDKLMSNRESDIQNFVSFITKDSIQKSLGMYLEMLKKKKQTKREKSWKHRCLLCFGINSCA